MKDSDNKENTKHGRFTPVDQLPDGASVINPPKDISFEPMSGSGGSGGSGVATDKISACKGKEENDACSWVYQNKTYKGKCKYFGGPLHCSDLGGRTL